MLADGLLSRLMQLSTMEDQEIRVSVLWALKNLLCKSSLATKRTVMTHLGWTHLTEYVPWHCIESSLTLDLSLTQTRK